MRKILSVFKRDYEGNRQVYDEVVEGCEWVLAGEGVATAKWDGTCVRIGEDGGFYKRYDRKLTKAGRKTAPETRGPSDYKPAPEGWVAAEQLPNIDTGHWPGWLPVGDGPEDRWHREGLANCGGGDAGTYELLGPKVNANRHGFEQHTLIAHGADPVAQWLGPTLAMGLSFAGIRGMLAAMPGMEGIVWHHPDGRMAKIKRRDFGLPWPVE